MSIERGASDVFRRSRFRMGQEKSGGLHNADERVRAGGVRFGMSPRADPICRWSDR